MTHVLAHRLNAPAARRGRVLPSERPGLSFFAKRRLQKAERAYGMDAESARYRAELLKTLDLATGRRRD